MNEIGKVHYDRLGAPDGYRCGGCNAHGVKLWRDYNTFLDHQRLRCAACATKEAADDAAPVDDEGRHESKYGMRTDQVAGMVPAIPTAEGDTFWGYSSVPHAGVA